MTTPLTPEEEADLRGSLDLRIAAQGLPTVNPLSTADRVAFQRLLATLDRERRERVDPDLRARIEEALGSLTDDQVMYDHPTSMTGPMDPVLFVEFDAFEKAILAATVAPRESECTCDWKHLMTGEGHEPGCPSLAATPDHTVVGEEREAQIETITEALRITANDEGIGCPFVSDDGPDHHSPEFAAALYDAGLRATPRPR